MAHMHAYHGAAHQQEREHITQIELVVYARHQQHHQGHAQHEPCAGGQYVDVALGQLGAVAQCVAVEPKALHPRAQVGQRVQGVINQGRGLHGP